jgi:transcriptional regulator with XRE-family HTH domain
MNTADIIKKARMEAELTQQQLASHYKIPLRTLVDWERGTRTPPEYVLEFLLRCLKEDFAQTEDPAEHEEVLSAPKQLIFTDHIGKPLKEPVLSGVKRAYDDGEVQDLGNNTVDEEDNCRQDPKGKLYLVLEPENYGLDMGITFYVKEV